MADTILTIAFWVINGAIATGGLLSLWHGFYRP
jgi:hypothetical protein